jgi:hypothetical protein
MIRFLTSDDKYGDSRDFAGDYRFGRSAGGRRRAATRLARVNGYLKTAIAAIADSKMRRMERELELRGIRFERSNNHWGASNPGRVSKG